MDESKLIEMHAVVDQECALEEARAWFRDAGDARAFMRCLVGPGETLQCVPSLLRWSPATDDRTVSGLVDAHVRPAGDDGDKGPVGLREELWRHEFANGPSSIRSVRVDFLTDGSWLVASGPHVGADKFRRSFRDKAAVIEFLAMLIAEIG